MSPLPKVLAAIGAFAASLLITRKIMNRSKSPYREIKEPLDPYAAKDPTEAGQCSPTPKPGVKSFRDWMIALFGERAGSPQNILRDCKTGSPSEHWEGRAWDWMISSPAKAEELIGMLLTSDSYGQDALARRAGIMYMIYNKRMWRAYPHAGLPSGSWHAYSGASPHTDHIHFSFSWPGANAETSLYKDIDKRIAAAKQQANA